MRKVALRRLRKNWHQPVVVALTFVIVLATLTGLSEAASASGGSGGTSVKKFGVPSDAGLTPRYGGTLTIGTSGGGSDETLDPETALFDSDFARIAALYNPLVSFAPNGGLDYQLATSITGNADATVWTIHLRPDVHFTDGSTLNASDVLFTWQQIVAKGAFGSQPDSVINLKASHAEGPLTVVAVLKQPVAIFPDYLAMDNQYIVKDGETNFSHPDGTGPFNFVSWTPGVSSTFIAKTDYWQKGLPYLHKLVIDSLNDLNSGVEALISGSLDVMTVMPYSDISEVVNNGTARVVNVPGSLSPSFYMRTDVYPFNKPKVREAFKLAINRQQCVDSALGGYGSVGNDLLGPGTAIYDHQISQRTYDPTEAKKLLKEAGVHLPLKVTLVTGEAGPGMNECSAIFQQSALAAGVDIKIHVVPPSSVYDTATGYLSRSFGSSQYEGMSFEEYVLESVLATSPDNEQHFKSAAFDALWNQAIGTTNASKRSKLLDSLQKMFWNDSGSIDWGIQDSLLGFNKKVEGESYLCSPIQNLFPWKGLQYLWLKK